MRKSTLAIYTGVLYAGSLLLGIWAGIFDLAWLVQSTSQLTVVLGTVALVAVPIGIYFDTKYMNSNAGTDYTSWIWVLLSIPANALVAVLYLIHRRQHLPIDTGELQQD